MADEKMTQSRPVEPVRVAVIATGDASRLPMNTLVETPDSDQPNIVMKSIPPLVAVLVRFANTFLTVLLGLVTGSLATNVIPAKDFLDLVMKCAGLSVAGAGIGLIKDLVTIFSGLEQRYPLKTGNV